MTSDPIYRAQHGKNAAWLSRLSVLVIGAALCAGCSGGSASPSTGQPSSGAETASPSSAPPSEGLGVVTLGDSWPEGAHCSGCRSFPDRYADGLQDLTGKVISATNLAGERNRTTEALLNSLRSDAEIQDGVAGADIVVIATGPNEADAAWTSASHGTCGGDDGLECIRQLGRMWIENLDAAVTEIEHLRDGKPTAIRLLSADNPFFSVPAFHENFGLPADFGLSGGTLTFELFTQAVCDVAETHDAVCIDVRPILNGPDLTQVVDVETDENHQAVADAILATGLPELGIAPAPIIGEWVAIQECQRIADMLGTSGLDEFIPDQVYEFLPGADSPEDVDPERPCANAVTLRHSHFFTAGGEFGSKDFDARQVDDGTYEVRGSMLIINGAAFAFEVDGNALTLQPEPVDIGSCTTRECRFQGAWVLMVAMPGTEWVRGAISP